VESVLLFSVFLVLMLVGVPIGTALGTAGVLALFTFDLGGAMVGTNFVHGIASFPLLAIPFFILAGVIMERAGIAARIAGLFERIVGPRAGGLAVVAVLTCMFWGALSGSGPATTAAVGLILLAPMVRHGYDADFAAATIANASDLSIIIPPSIAFIIYGNITGVSVSALFLAGIVPGLLMGAGVAAAAWWLSRRKGYRGPAGRGAARDILRALKDAVWALLSPVIILGGIYSGVFTPTEAAVVAVFYSLFAAAAIYRSLSLRQLLDALVDAAVTSSVIMFLVAFAGIFSWAVSTTGLTDRAAAWIAGVAPNALAMVLLVNLMLLVMGMFLDAISISYLVMPILMPVLAAFGIDPLWYGVVFITALAIGQTTPPVGVNLFTAANLIESDVDAVSRRIIPYVAVNVAVLVVLSAVPALSLYLPVRLGLHVP
jgi:C4-dicarboxylate transporter DctM subunit